MIPIKTDFEIQKMREACLVAATVLDRVCNRVVEGISTYELDQLGKLYISELGARSACYDYNVGGRRFPSYTCISVNEEIVHGIGTKNRIIKSGDCVSVDIVVQYGEFIGDNARTVTVGTVDPKVEELVQTAEDAFYYALKSVKPGKRVGDISNAVQTFVEKRDFSIIRDFVGHGVGREMHEEPQIPNFGKKKTGSRLQAGMTLAIEPMITMGSPVIEILPDGWTAVTKDRKSASHFEHTVLVCDDKPEILTKLKN